ncbi:uncharacterized protein PV09_05440 [Verruconis gallopava]|uniref:Zn(2)-C6 fungal-type domain-containing protein n=1 Tax=Verruconis gallopava TaxID=253628 RepID=A0A0D1XLB8_9PEZI|nr:uncharacterized protein PV09_05440 [Verruconis gallopava]KIW03216.1 hypothetical protein PV09_05440 [Verruconis gallopava]
MSLPPPTNASAQAGQSPSQSNTPVTSTPPSSGPTKPTYSKRGKITIVACVNCRRRKTKCDGQRPVCAQCQARDGAQCHYDMNEEQRRLTYLRENVEQLHEEKSALESLIHNLRISPEDEAIAILRRLRQGTDPHTLVQHIQVGRTLTKVSNPTTEAPPPPAGLSDVHARLIQSITKASPEEIDEIIRRLRIHENAGSILNSIQGGGLLQPLEKSGIYSAPEHIFGLTRAGQQTSTELSNASHLHRGQQPRQVLTPKGNPSKFWISAPLNGQYDQDIVNHALRLYFTWQHCFFQSFPQALFLQDMSSGSTKYCSRLLVNAVCSAGCLLSPWSELPTGNQRPQEVSRITFDDAVRELAMVDEPSIPTIAGLFILSHVEGNRGRMHRAWDYCGRAARMALDLNLHLRDDRQGVDEVEVRAKSHAFWGCFIADQLLSFTLGRIPQIPITAITIDLPSIVEADDLAPWEPVGDGSKTKVPGARSTTFYEVASLSRILNSTLYLFFAPSQVLKGSLLLDEYNKYKAWYSRLPPIVQLVDEPAPHVLCLHMYYHAAVLLLFRPFLKAKFTQSNVSPSEVCRASAASISRLFNQHRRLYDSVGIYTLQMHCLLAACTIHIINTPAIASTQYLISAAKHFHDLAHVNGWAVECISILKNLVEKWQIVLPMEADLALFQDTAARTSHDENESGRAKRSAFAPPDVPPNPQQKKPKLAIPRMLGRSPSSEQSSSGSAESPASRPNSSLAGHSSTANESSKGSNPPGLHREATSQLNYLFAPFPNQPAPMLAPTHSSDVLEMESRGQMPQQPRVDFDGLTFESGTGWFDPFMGFDTAGSIGEGEQRP